MTSELELAPRARIVCVCSDEKALAELTTSFRAAGYLLQSADVATHADLALVDLRGRKKIAGKKAVAIANLLRRKSPECSLFFIVDPDLGSPARSALKRHGEIVCMTDAAGPLIERCRNMIRLRNIAEETGERLKSLAALCRLVEFPSIATSDTRPHVLIAGHPGGPALSVINAINQIAEQSICVLSVGQTMRALEHGSFDCAIFLPADENDPLFSLARALRRHPQHSTLPIIHVADDPSLAALYASKGAREFALSAHIPDDLAGKVQLLTRRARLTRTMRDFLQACTGDGVRDAPSGAFTPTFLAEHGARLCARADQMSRPMSAVIIQLSVDKKNAENVEPGRRALHQATRLINRVTRAEDMVARIAPHTFLILMPSTNETAAADVALRIEGVLESTVFRGAKDSEFFPVRAQTAACVRTQGLCIEEMLALALRRLRQAAAENAKQPRQQFPK